NLDSAHPHVVQIYLTLGVVLLEEHGCLEAKDVLSPRELLTGRDQEQCAEKGGGGQEERGPLSAQPPDSPKAHEGAADQRRHREALDGAALRDVGPKQPGVVHRKLEAHCGERSEDGEYNSLEAPPDHRRMLAPAQPLLRTPGTSRSMTREELLDGAQAA